MGFFMLQCNMAAENSELHVLSENTCRELQFKEDVMCLEVENH